MSSHFEFVIDRSKGEDHEVYMTKLKNVLIETFSNIVQNMPDNLVSIELGSYACIPLDSENENSPIKYFGNFLVKTYLTDDMIGLKYKVVV